MGDDLDENCLCSACASQATCEDCNEIFDRGDHCTCCPFVCDGCEQERNDGPKPQKRTRDEEELDSTAAAQAELELLTFCAAVCNFTDARRAVEPAEEKLTRLEVHIQRMGRTRSMLHAHAHAHATCTCICRCSVVHAHAVYDLLACTSMGPAYFTQVERKHAAESAEKAAEAQRAGLRQACVEQGVDAACFPPAQPWSLFPWREQLQPGSDVEEGLRHALELREPLELHAQLERARALGFTPRGCPQFFAAEELLGQLRYDQLGTPSDTPMEGDSGAALDPVEGRALGRKALQCFLEPVDNSISTTVPQTRQLVDVLGEKCEKWRAEGLIKEGADTERRASILALVSASTCASLELQTEQHREQEQEQEAEQEQCGERLEPLHCAPAPLHRRRQLKCPPLRGTGRRRWRWRSSSTSPTAATPRRRARGPSARSPALPQRGCLRSRR